MALFEAGTFTSSAGPQDVTLANLASETPKAVIVWHAGHTTSGITAGAKLGFGAAVSASSRAAVFIASEDNQLTSDTDRRHTNAKVLTLLDYAGAVIEEGDIALAAGKFTITYSTSLTGVVYNYLAIGGDDVEASLIELQSPASTGEQSYAHSLSGAPDALIGFASPTSVAPPSTGVEGTIEIGVWGGSSSRVVAFSSEDAEGTSDTWRYAGSKLFAHPWEGLDYDVATVSSVDGTNVSLSWTKRTAVQRYHWILALRGVSAKLITGDCPSTDSTVSRSIGFSPKAALGITHMGAGTGFTDDVPSGLTGQSHKFDGGNDVAKLTAADWRSGDSQGSLSFWIKNSDPDVARVFASSDEASTARYLHIGSNASGNVYVQQRNNDTQDNVSGDTNVHDGDWHHVAVVSNGTAYAIYVDGAVESLTIASGANTGDWLADTANRDNLTFGAFIRSSSAYGPSYLHDVRYYDDALSADEITYLYTNGTSGTDPTTTNLQGHWKFDGDFTDETANSYDLTFSGSVNDDARIGIGAWDSSGNNVFAGAVDEDAQATTDCDRVQRSTLALQHIDHTQTVKGSATLAASGTNLNEVWTDIEAAIEHSWLVMGTKTALDDIAAEALVKDLAESLAESLTGN